MFSYGESECATVRIGRPVCACFDHCVRLILVAAVFCLPVCAKPKTRLVPVRAYDMVFSPTTSRLYVSVPSNAPQFANTITVINPKKGKITSSVPVGTQPTQLAISDDGRYVYVIVDGPRVQRLNVDTLRIDLDFPVEFGNAPDPPIIANIQVMPGHPGSVAISSFRGAIAVFDNGVRRPVVSPQSDGIRDLGTLVFCFGASGDTIWGYNTLNDGFELWKFKVDQQGVSLAGKAARGLMNAFRQKLQFSNGLLYTTNGRAINPEARTFDGRFYTTDVVFASDFTIDADNGQIFFLSASGYDVSFSAFDMRTYRLTGYYQTAYAALPSDPTVGDGTGRMTLCGSVGLALAGRGVVILPFARLKAPLPYEKPKPAPLNGGIRRIALPNNALVYDGTSRQIYASTPGPVGNIGNSIVAVDPFRGTVADAVWAGSEPWQLTISDGSEYLYVSLYGGSAVRRFRLPDLTPDLRFPMFADYSAFYGSVEGSVPTRAAEMLPVPGLPGSVIVARAQAPGLDVPSADGVVVFDDGVARPATTPAQPWGFDEGPVNTIQLSSSGSLIYGLDNEVDDFKFFTLSLTPDGVHVLSKQWRVGTGFGAVMKCQSELCFTNNGGIIDPATQSRLGLIDLGNNSGDPLFGTLVVPDVPRGRVYYLLGRRSGVYIETYSIAIKQKLASLKVLDLSAPVRDFLLWNNDQFAFSTGEEIVLVPLSLLQPKPAT
jgi:hypothetical protein